MIPSSGKIFMVVLATALVAMGIFYLFWPAVAQRMLLRRMRRSGELGADVARKPSFLWALRLIGLAAIVVAIRGYYAILHCHTVALEMRT